jgi:signal transduction histidine kinase
MRVGNVAALRRVLLNLATNAVKFTSRGSVDLLAEVGTAAEVRFIVQDSGRGLPAAVRDAARGVPLHEDAGFSSAGLGLSICRRLVVGLGGTLEVRSEPERGTRFDVVLELAR